MFGLPKKIQIIELSGKKLKGSSLSFFPQVEKILCPEISSLTSSGSLSGQRNAEVVGKGKRNLRFTRSSTPTCGKSQLRDRILSIDFGLDRFGLRDKLSPSIFFFAHSQPPNEQFRFRLFSH